MTTDRERVLREALERLEKAAAIFVYEGDGRGDLIHHLAHAADVRAALAAAPPEEHRTIGGTPIDMSRPEEPLVPPYKTTLPRFLEAHAAPPRNDQEAAQLARLEAGDLEAFKASLLESVQLYADTEAGRKGMGSPVLAGMVFSGIERELAMLLAAARSLPPSEPSEAAIQAATLAYWNHGSDAMMQALRAAYAAERVGSLEGGT